MASLYQIDKQIEYLLNYAGMVNEDGEITNEELFEQFEQLQIDRTEKIENIGLYIKNITAENAAINNEIKAFKERIEANKKTIERLEALAVRGCGGENFSTAKVAISFRKSTGTIITDESLIPKEYIIHKVKETEDIDKAKIKKVLMQARKEGIELEIAGAALEDRLNVKVV